jgi:hypothetical protein
MARRSKGLQFAILLRARQNGSRRSVRESPGCVAQCLPTSFPGGRRLLPPICPDRYSLIAHLFARQENGPNLYFNQTAHSDTRMKPCRPGFFEFRPGFFEFIVVSYSRQPSPDENAHRPLGIPSALDAPVSGCQKLQNELVGVLTEAGTFQTTLEKNRGRRKWRPWLEHSPQTLLASCSTAAGVSCGN